MTDKEREAWQQKMADNEREFWEPVAQQLTDAVKKDVETEFEAMSAICGPVDRKYHQTFMSTLAKFPPLVGTLRIRHEK